MESVSGGNARKIGQDMGGQSHVNIYEKVPPQDSCRDNTIPLWKKDGRREREIRFLRLATPSSRSSDWNNNRDHIVRPFRQQSLAVEALPYFRLFSTRSRDNDLLCCSHTHTRTDMVNLSLSLWLKHWSLLVACFCCCCRCERLCVTFHNVHRGERRTDSSLKFKIT
jgi:hypothetical protein